MKLNNINFSKRRQKVFVAMSGGVDSSVAALLMQKTGYDVFGIFMREWTPAGIVCNEAENRRMAARAAAHLNIPFAVWDFRKEYEKRVAAYMLREYTAGRTPNPDVMCNSTIKFGVFLNAARMAGADYIATGHYIQKQNYTDLINGSLQSRSNSKFKIIYTLLEAVDKNKDQSYFLWTLTQQQIRHCLFPLGAYTKPNVRMMAKKAGLPNWDRKDSQGVCFVGALDFAAFLRSCLPVHTGRTVAPSGHEIGTHEGTLLYTIGQRWTGQVMAAQNAGHNRHKLFVAEKNIKTNTLVVAGEHDRALYTSAIRVAGVNWITGAMPPAPLSCRVRIRHRQPLQKATLCHLKDGNVAIRFTKPQRAVAPGQSAVWHAADGTLLGGGIIA